MFCRESCDKQGTQSVCIDLLKRLPSVASLIEVYKSIKPTNKKVLVLISAEPANNSERSVVGLLRKYIRGLDVKMLCKFLRFCAGGNVLCSGNITISFTSLDGAARRPVAHTCGPVLEIPTTYSSFPEFRQDMNVLICGLWDIDYA